MIRDYKDKTICIYLRKKFHVDSLVQTFEIFFETIEMQFALRRDKDFLRKF